MEQTLFIDYLTLNVWNTLGKLEQVQFLNLYVISEEKKSKQITIIKVSVDFMKNR